MSEGQRGRYNVLVYVGATWCEPCQRFHQSLSAGEFDTILPGAHLIEFDLDADKEALAAAGYTSKLIPLFCVPKSDGTASDRRIEGSIKGPDAVKENLLPRIRSFLAGSTAG
jgi:thiol-disulfide isomerase/thioredoxin